MASVQIGTYRKDPLMSLTVPLDLLEQARHGEVEDVAFTACIKRT